MDIDEIERNIEIAANLLKALSNEKRLLVICALYKGEKSVRQLEEIIGLSQSALSQHLARLRQDKLVDTRREAQTIGDVKLVINEIPFRDLSIPAKIRAATLGDAFVRNEAIRDPVRMVATAAIKSPGVTDIEVARYARNQALAEDVIRFIAQKREWTKMYGVKVSLCRNPKTPISESARMLPFLRERDLTEIVRSKGIPSAVVAQARKLQQQRGKR